MYNIEICNVLLFFVIFAFSKLFELAGAIPYCIPLSMIDYEQGEINNILN